MSALNLWNDRVFSNDIFSDFFDWEGPRRVSTEAKNNFSPACNVSEAKEHYLLSFDLPGMKLDDINVEIEKDSLVVSGERHHVQDDKDEKMHRVERFSGSFKRAFRIPDGVTKDQVAATYKDGVLKIAVAKVANTAKATKINITKDDDSIFKKIAKTVAN